MGLWKRFYEKDVLEKWLHKEQGSLTTSVVILWSVRYKHVPNAKIKGVFRKLCCSHGNLKFQKFFHQQSCLMLLFSRCCYCQHQRKTDCFKRINWSKSHNGLELKVKLNDSYVEWRFFHSMSSVFNRVDLIFMACEMSIRLFRLLFHTPLIFVLTCFKQL